MGKWYVGQKVWDEALKPGLAGRVDAYNSKSNYPINVIFDDSAGLAYTEDGNIYRNTTPTLRPYPHKITIERIEPEFEKGQIVLVRDSNDDKWIGAFYIERRDAVYEHKVQVPNELDFSVYYQCISFKGNEHLLLTTQEA